MSDQESVYIRVRTLEGRIYSDDAVKRLPEVSEHDPHKQEWKIRAASLVKLRSRLLQKNAALDILDLGCGNGWMTHHLSRMEESKVIGLDVNQIELEQATRVFRDQKNLKFIYGNLEEDIISLKSFDVIVLAASIQYFADLKKLITALAQLLKPSGEIHIIDSPVYHEREVAAARKRSNDYYAKLGVPEMINFYFHHHWNELSSFSYSILNRSIPEQVALHFLRDKSLMFPWIMIKN